MNIIMKCINIFQMLLLIVMISIFGWATAGTIPMAGQLAGFASMGVFFWYFAGFIMPCD